MPTDNDRGFYVAVTVTAENLAALNTIEELRQCLDQRFALARETLELVLLQHLASVKS